MKKILIGIASFAIISLILFACNKSKYSDYSQTETGLLYKFHHRSGDTTGPNFEELLTLKMQYGTEDTILFTSDEASRPMVLMFKESDYAGDIYEGLALMKIGDSATFITRADSFFIKTARSARVPGFIDSDAKMIFNISLISAQTQEEFQEAELKRDEIKRAEEKSILEKYLQDNNIGVEPTVTGLYFIEQQAGQGSFPEEGDWVKILFDISLIDGTPVYSSENNPLEFEYGKPFDTDGLAEGVGMMKKGGKARLIVSSDIGLGKRGRGDMVPPFSTMIYDVEIVDILSGDEYKLEQERINNERMVKNEQNLVESKQFLEANKQKEGVVELPSGLQYKIIKQGDGEKPESTDIVSVHYHGTVIDGTVFDSSIERGQPSTFNVSGVISGWTEALQLMPVGSKWILYIPPELAYKDQARGNVIEPNMALIFEVELLEIVDK